MRRLFSSCVNLPKLTWLYQINWGWKRLLEPTIWQQPKLQLFLTLDYFPEQLHLIVPEVNISLPFHRRFSFAIVNLTYISINAKENKTQAAQIFLFFLFIICFFIIVKASRWIKNQTAIVNSLPTLTTNETSKLIPIKSRIFLFYVAICV